MGLTSNQFTVRVIGQSQFAATATNLAVGSYVDLSTGTGMSANPYSSGDDIQWMSVCAYYDPARKELQYMGKWASNQDTSGTFYHYIWDEMTNTWYRPLQGSLIGGGTTGHIFQAGFDENTGNYYTGFYNTEYFKWFNRDGWVSAGKPNPANGIPSYWNNTTTTNTSLFTTGATETNAVTIHPNCFGLNDKGLVVGSEAFIWGYRFADNTWYKLSSDFSGISGVWAGARGNGGGGVYCPGADVAVVGFGNTQPSNAPGPAWKVPAGTGAGNRTTATYGQVPMPFECASGNASTQGKVLQHPSNREVLLALQNGTGEVYQSTNYGVTWTDAGYNHPFAIGNWGLASGSWVYTCCTVHGKDVILGLRSAGAGFSVRMWKPG